MAKIVVSVVDADDISIARVPVTFKPEPPKACEAIIKEILNVGYGRGQLLDKDGDTVTQSELVPGGNYKHRVAGSCTVQVCMRGILSKWRSACGWESVGQVGAYVWTHQHPHSQAAYPLLPASR